MRRLCSAFIFVALPLASALLVAQKARPAKPPTVVDVASLDRSADACTDFYRFACGGWIAANPLPPDRQRFGRFTELQERHYAVLRRILETPAGSAASREPGDRPEHGRETMSSGRADEDLRKARDYYAACLTVPANATALEPELARIAAVRSRDDLPDVVARLHALIGETPPAGSSRRAGHYVFFTFGARPKFDDAITQIANIGTDGIALPSRDSYLMTDERSVTQRNLYHDHVAYMLALAGANAADASRSADSVLSIETALAKATLDAAARRDPNTVRHDMTVEGLQRLTPAFNWRRYILASGAPPFDTLNVSEPEFLKEVNRLLTDTPLEDVKRYLTWHLVHGASARLPAAFNDATFDFFSRTLAGQEQPSPRWRECIADTDQQLGDALGKAFVDVAFGPQAKADTLGMVKDIKDAMRRDIAAAAWMSAETKQAASAKLDAVIDRIGYPDAWRSYASVVVSPTDPLGNLQRALAFHNAQRIARIGRPVDRGEWSMTPPTVNAYYSSTSNNINFPAGILQPPFYRTDGDAALNYGAIGAVIGHELSHGFDDQGRKYDGRGNLRNWWTPGDAKAYEERSACIADQYADYLVAGDTHVNGRLTLGENTADNGGLRLALMAYLAGPGAAIPAGGSSAVDGFEPEQRVFLGWAQQWCESSRPDAERLKALTNPHSANQYRVNGVVSNMPEFATAFSCKPGSPMVRQNACRVW